MSYLTAKEPIITTSMTVGAVLQMMHGGLIDRSPVFQRGCIASSDWSRGIIKSVLCRSTKLIIHLRAMPDGTYQVLDGLQRLTALWLFHTGAIASPVTPEGPLTFTVNRAPILLPATKFRGLSARGLLSHFMNTSLLMVIFDKAMTDDEASEQFWTLNNGNTLSAQEKRSGILGEVATFVRDSSRGKRPLGVVSVMAKKSNGRMDIDEMIARSVLMEHWHQTQHHGIYEGYTDTKNLDILYRAHEYRYDRVALTPIIQEVVRRWGMVEKMIVASGAPKIHTTNLGRVLTLYQLTYLLEETYGRVVKLNYPVFAKKLWVAFSTLLQSDRLYLVSSSEEETLDQRKKMFAQLLGQYSPTEVRIKLSILLETVRGMKAHGIVSVDRRRVFSVMMKYRRWVEVGGRCEISGAPVRFDLAIGGHRVPYASGGRTTYDNLIILSQEVNTQMGDLSVMEYMSIMKTPRKRKKVTR